MNYRSPAKKLNKKVGVESEVPDPDLLTKKLYVVPKNLQTRIYVDIKNFSFYFTIFSGNR